MSSNALSGPPKPASASATIGAIPRVAVGPPAPPPGRQRPGARGAEPRDRVLDGERAAETDDVRGGIRALDAAPSRVGGPPRLEGLGVAADPVGVRAGGSRG